MNKLEPLLSKSDQPADDRLLPEALPSSAIPLRFPVVQRFAARVAFGAHVCADPDCQV
jgi:hypothetical protein